MCGRSQKKSLGLKKSWSVLGYYLEKPGVKSHVSSLCHQLKSRYDHGTPEPRGYASATVCVDVQSSVGAVLDVDSRVREMVGHQPSNQIHQNQSVYMYGKCVSTSRDNTRYYRDKLKCTGENI